MQNKTFSYRLGESVVRTLTPISTRFSESGAQNLPREGGCIVVANHISHADPFVVAQFLTGHQRMPRFLTKDSLFDVPVVGAVLRNSGQIPVRRESTDALVALGAAEQALLDGECVVIYPEGTLTRDPQLWPMRGKLGPARLALATGVPVIPVAQWGTQNLLPGYRKVPRVYKRPKVQVIAGPAVDLSPFKPEGDQPPNVRQLLQATAVIMAELTALLGQLRGEQPPGTVWNPRAHGQSVTGDPHRVKRALRRPRSNSKDEST